MCLQNERVYSLLVSSGNECVYLFHVYLSTHWTSTTENIKDVYENRAPGYMVKTPNVGGGYPLESAS